MKRSSLLLLLIGVAIIFFGCEKMDPLVPDSNIDQEVSSLKGAKVEIEFTGTCKPTMTPPEEPFPGEVKVLPNGKTKIKGEYAWWYDEASTPLLTGYSKWNINRIIDVDGVQKIWGKTDIVLDNDLGIWILSWHGYLYPTLDETGAPMGIHGSCEGVATGVEGSVKGMTAKMLYTINFLFDDPSTLFYATKGVINPHGN